jgi:hypothetical protein
MDQTLREIAGVKQTCALRRRWWNSKRMDVYVWQDDRGNVHSFEICYGKPRNERALRWQAEQGFSHARIDDGEAHAFDHQTPIAVPDGDFSRELIAQRFEAAGAEIEPAVYRQLMRQLF